MTLPTFTLVVGDGFASRIGTTRTALAGATVVLKTNIGAGGLLRIDSGIEHIETVVTTLDEDGKLNGDTGIELLANDDSLNINDPLEWEITILGAKSQGFTRIINPFSFPAGEAGSTVNLELVLPAPGQDSRRGPRAYGIVSAHFEDGDLVVENEDGSTFPITPGDGAYLFVDNGDGTVSVG